MKKKKMYLRPAILCMALETGDLLAGSERIDISDEPATQPACSNSFGDMPDSFSPWDDNY